MPPDARGGTSEDELPALESYRHPGEDSLPAEEPQHQAAGRWGGAGSHVALASCEASDREEVAGLLLPEAVRSGKRNREADSRQAVRCLGSHFVTWQRFSHR